MYYQWGYILTETCGTLCKINLTQAQLGRAECVFLSQYIYHRRIVYQRESQSVKHLQRVFSLLFFNDDVGFASI